MIIMIKKIMIIIIIIIIIVLGIPTYRIRQAAKASAGTE